MARWLLIAVALCALATVAGARAFNALALPRITTDVARLSAGRLFCPAGSDRPDPGLRDGADPGARQAH